MDTRGGVGGVAGIGAKSSGEDPVCPGDAYAAGCLSTGEKTGDRGHRRKSDGQEGGGRRTRPRGQQPLALGEGAGRRHGQCTDGRSRHPPGKAGPHRRQGPQRRDPPGAVLVRGRRSSNPCPGPGRVGRPGTRTPVKCRKAAPTPAADAGRGRAPFGRCHVLRQGGPGTPQSGAPGTVRL